MKKPITKLDVANFVIMSTLVSNSIETLLDKKDVEITDTEKVQQLTLNPVVNRMKQAAEGESK